MRWTSLLVLALLSAPPAFADAHNAPGTPAFRDGGLSFLVISDRLRTYQLQWSIEVGSFLRWGAFFGLGAEWPARTPAGSSSGGIAGGVGGSLAARFSQLTAIVLQSGFNGVSIPCRDDACRAARPDGGGGTNWVTRALLRMSIQPSTDRGSFEFLAGPCYVRRLGGDVDPPSGLGITVAIGVGAHD